MKRIDKIAQLVRKFERLIARLERFRGRPQIVQKIARKMDWLASRMLDESEKEMFIARFR